MVKSPNKVITSGTAPTTTNTAKGDLAFGTVDGETKLYGNTGTEVVELGGGGGSEVNVIAPLTVATAPTTYDGDTSSIVAGDKATSGTGDLSKFPETWRQQIENLISSADGHLSDVSIGGAASTTGLGNVAVGNGTNAGTVEYDESAPEASMYKLIDNIAIGTGAVATGGLSTAIGGGGIASGNGAKSTGLYSVAIGTFASASGMSSVAIGSGSSATGEGEFSVGGGSPTITRRITNVTDPTGDQDAATKKYVDTKVASIPAGTTVNSIAPLTVETAPTATGQNASAIGSQTTAGGTAAVAIGNEAVGSGNYSVALGNRSDATAMSTTALGYASNASADYSVALGRGSQADEADTVSVGSGIGGDSYQTRRIVRVTDPVNAQDAATKKYVDDQYTTLESQIDDKGSAITTLQGQVSTLETTVAGKADTSALNNYATKTELNAKANQTAVDSLTTTVNGKVSSVTAGEGISITGTATEPVISASSENIFFTPDFDNAEYFRSGVGETTWTFSEDGFVKPGGRYSQAGQPPAGYTDVRWRIKSANQSVYAEGSASIYMRAGNSSATTAPIIPVKAGDSIEVADGASGLDVDIWSHDTVDTSGVFFPIRQSAITPGEPASFPGLDYTQKEDYTVRFSQTGGFTAPSDGLVRIGFITGDTVNTKVCTINGTNFDCSTNYIVWTTFFLSAGDELKPTSSFTGATTIEFIPVRSA